MLPVSPRVRGEGPRARAPRVQLSEVSDPVTALTAQRLKVLGHPLRINLIERLCHSPATVNELVEAVGGTQQNISEHLLTLHQVGIVAREKDGRNVRYRLVDPHVIELLDKAREGVTHHLGELARLIVTTS
jgi:DNA-binding transcriptional ArsR family regulator